MDATPTSRGGTPVDDSERPPRRTYRRRTVPSSKASSVNRKHEDGRNTTTKDVIIEFQVKSTVPLWWILSSATQLLVDHLLYSRGIIPLSVAQLRDKKQEEILKSRSQRRKVAQCRNQLQSWNFEWTLIDPRVLENCSCILISFGPSFLRSREFYILNVAEEKNSPEHPTSKLPPMHALARRLLPRVLEYDKDLPNRLAPSFQLWVSLLVEADVLERALNDDASNEFSNHVIRRPGYKLPEGRSLKHNQRVVRIDILNTENNTGPSEAKKSTSISATDVAHWITLRTSIKGFRLST